MKGPLYNTEFADNPEPRCAVALIVDRSASMNIDDGIGKLTSALAQFKSAVSADTLCALRLELAVIPFNHEVGLSDFCSVEAFEPPELNASGGTRIPIAINTALDLIDRRKQAYREAGISYYRPVALLLTDGKFEHDTPQELAMVRQRLVSEEEGKHAAFFAFGIGDVDMETLSQITPPNRPPEHIGSVENIAGLFEWLSRSVERIVQADPGDRVKLGKVDEYLDKYDY